MFNVLSNKYLKFVDAALAASGNSHLEIYSCKYSKRKYTQHQLMALILLKEYLKTDYRSIVELVQLMNPVKSRIGLKQVPIILRFISSLKELNLFTLMDY